MWLLEESKRMPEDEKMTDISDELRDEEMKRLYEEVRDIEGHCAKCGKIVFQMRGDWETWMTSNPVFCIDCYREALRVGGRGR